MDSTARLVTLLSGWAGHNQAIETTQGILAKHLGKSVRQIQRMLQDAIREGLLSYNYTKSRATGMITGIRIYLRFSRIRRQKPSQSRSFSGATKESHTKTNLLLNTKDKALEERLRSFSGALGVNYPLE